MTDDLTNRRIQKEIDAFLASLEPTPAWKAYSEQVQCTPEYRDALEALERDGSKGLEPFVAKYRKSALAKAEAGDVSEIAVLMRAGTILNEKEREFAANYIDGKIPASKGAPKDHNLTLRVALAFFWLREIDGMKYEAAVSEIETLVDRSRSTVKGRITAGKKCAITQDQLGALRSSLKFCQPKVVNYLRQMHLRSE